MSSAIRWAALEKETGSVRPRPRPSGSRAPLEAHAAWLKDLANHIVDERHAYFHAWRKNDMVVWDNWRVLHSAKGVPLDCRRLAVRTTILGDYGHGRYLDPSLDRNRAYARFDD